MKFENIEHLGNTDRFGSPESLDSSSSIIESVQTWKKIASREEKVWSVEEITLHHFAIELDAVSSFYYTITAIEDCNASKSTKTFKTFDSFGIQDIRDSKVLRLQTFWTRDF